MDDDEEDWAQAVEERITTRKFVNGIVAVHEQVGMEVPIWLR